MPRRPGLRALGSRTETTRAAEAKKADDGACEQRVERNDSQKCCRQHGADEAFQIIGETGQRKRPRVVLLIGKHVRNGCMKGRREGGRSRLENEDQYIDLPDFRNERQADGDGSANEIKHNQHRASRQNLSKSPRNRCDTHIGDHLDRKRGAKDRSRMRACDVIGKKPERDGRESRTDQGNDLRQKQMAVGAVLEDVEHVSIFRCLSSQVLRDGPEFVHGLTLAFGEITDRVLKAVIEMILYQRPLGVADGTFDRVQLLGEIEAWTAFADHFDHAPEVPLGAAQALCDLGMGFVSMVAHGMTLSSRGGCFNSGSRARKRTDQSRPKPAASCRKALDVRRRRRILASLP